MKILIVGGNGMIGGHAALRLAAAGHAVTIGSRTEPAAGTPLATLPWERIDYLATQEPAVLGRFDALVFAAGNDIRHVPPGEDEAAHWQRANAKGVPRFFAAAKAAGVRHAIMIGSFYPQAAPELVAKNKYVAGRAAADTGVRALADDRFHVVSLNAPFVIGQVPGLFVPAYDAWARWGLGQLPIPPIAPAGGVNVISCDTLTDAIEAVLDGRGRSGHAYLIGDENLSFADLFGLFFKHAGNDAPLEVVDAEHPLLPDAAIYRGRGSTIYYDAEPTELCEIGYRQNDIARTVALIVAAVRGVPAVGELEELVAIERLKTLKARYWRSVDTKDAALLRSVFADDAIADYRGAVGRIDDDDMLMRGADLICARTLGGLQGIQTAHHGHAPEITVTSPTTATGIWAMEDLLWGDQASPPFKLVQGWGHYHDSYLKTPAGWKIAKTRLVRLRLNAS